MQRDQTMFIFHRLIPALVVAMLAACAQLPERPKLATTNALSSNADTTLGRIATQNLGGTDKSGFQLMPVASNAYATRIALCDKAEKTLDVQYYLLAADNSGKVLLRCLKRAAGRGVRVRVLIDDYYTPGEDALLLAFAATPNVEVRLFNPFPAWRSSSLGRFVAAAFDFGRVDHRMHNKLFLADNAMAVAGGRNMADEYFMRAKGNNFVDMDIMAVGPIVTQLSAIFDVYWNSEYVYPLQSIVSNTLSTQEEGAEFDRLVDSASGPIIEDQLDPRLAPFLGTPEDLDRGKLKLIFAPARAYADPVDKVEGRYAANREGTVRAQVAIAMRAANHSVTVLSPYFVPGPLGMEAMQGLSQRGVKLTLITNSLASTDEPFAHGAYTESRLPMLRLGVTIYEISPELTRKSERLGQFGDSYGRLHAKVAIIDHRKLFIGSMNLDERSERLNTELGLFIDSPELVSQFEARSALLDGAYRLELAPNGDSIRWVGRNGPDRVVLETEPETDWWLRLKVRLLSGLVPPSEL
jgi:putative cardiolipin synthase